MTVDVLSCSISRNSRRRILLDRDALARVAQEVSQIRIYSIDQADDEDKEYLSRYQVEIIIQTSDGTEYKSDSIDVIEKIATGRNRVIESVSIRYIYGSMSCSVNIGERIYFSYRIIINGPEDKALFHADRIESILQEGRDFTEIFFAVKSPLFEITYVLLALLLFFWIQSGFASVDSPLKLIGLIGGLFTVAGLGGLLIAAFSEKLRDKWLPSVAFLWGENLRRHERAKACIYIVCAALPLWIIGNLLTATLLS